jgi:hypothetical protein
VFASAAPFVAGRRFVFFVVDDGGVLAANVVLLVEVADTVPAATAAAAAAAAAFDADEAPPPTLVFFFFSPSTGDEAADAVDVVAAPIAVSVDLFIVLVGEDFRLSLRSSFFRFGRFSSSTVADILHFNR